MFSWKEYWKLFRNSYIYQVLRSPKIYPFKDDLGADSLDLFEMVMALEDEYGVELSYEEIDRRVRTISDVIEYLREQGADI